MENITIEFFLYKFFSKSLFEYKEKHTIEIKTSKALKLKKQIVNSTRFLK